MALKQLINVAVAEKLLTLRMEGDFRKRSARGDATRALAVLDRAGRGDPSRMGDDLIGK